MTSYKKIAEEAENKLQESLYQIDVLQTRLRDAQTGLFDELCLRMETEEAREVLRMFAERAKNRDELVLLIRALSKL
jgi:hypothetical protein